jgi:hypothetical protein
MRFSLTVGVMIVAISASGLAQQSNTFKVKHSTPEKAPKSLPLARTPSLGTASAATSKDLQSVERQSAKSGAPSRSAGAKKTTPATKLKTVKDKPNAPINFGETGGGKKMGMVNQGANPYKGRLKQKRAQ